MTRGLFLLAFLMLSSGLFAAARLMDEQHARAKAAELLAGDPYGTSTREASRTIKDARLIRNGETLCGKKNPVWRFHVVVDKPVTNPQSPIDGYLFLDASNGKMVCANLPMLN